MPPTLRELLEQAARRHPDRTCFRTATGAASYRDALDESCRQARFISSDLRVLECMHSAGCLNHAAGRTVFLTVPLFHSYGLCSLLEYLSAGGTLVFPSGTSRFGTVGELNAPHVRDSVDAIEAVPYFYEQLVKLAGRLRPSQIVHVGFGGGAVSAITTEALQGYWPQARYSVRYGLTETPSVVSHKEGALAQWRDPRAAGSILSCYDVQIVDAKGRSVERGREGEIVLYGENLGSYLGAVPPEGFPTGDLGFLEHSGEVFVTGRKAAFLRNRGFRVSPQRIETLLMTMDGIRDGRVLMRDNRLLVELVADSDASPPQRAVIDYLAERLQAYYEFLPPPVDIEQVAAGRVYGWVEQHTRAENPSPGGSWWSAVVADREWNTPTLGFAPKWRSMSRRTCRLSATKVAMLWLLTSLRALQPWLRKSYRMRSKRLASSDQKG